MPAREAAASEEHIAVAAEPESGPLGVDTQDYSWTGTTLVRRDELDRWPAATQDTAEDEEERGEDAGGGAVRPSS
jgi:hypothetical protein